jgi:hypothetical protein
MIDVNRFFSVPSVDLIKITTQGASYIENGEILIEYNKFSGKLKIKLNHRENNIGAYILTYDPGMDWVVYEEVPTPSPKLNVVLRSVRTYFKQISTKESDYITPKVFGQLKLILEHLTIDHMVTNYGQPQ